MTFTIDVKKNLLLRPMLQWSVAVLIAIAILHTLPAPVALAAGPVVNTHLDENDHSCSDGDCSLRDAIETIPFWETRIITFAPTLAGQTISLTAGQLEIYTNLTISGTVPITISGNNASRVFYIGHTAAVAMSHLGIISGTADDGGGIYNDGGWMMISGSNISGNIATGDGGGIYNNGGRVIIYDSKITHNSAGVVGGGIFNVPFDNTVTVADSIISDNSARSGGGLYTFYGNAMVVSNCIISGNTYRSIHNENGIVIVKNSTISDNTGEIHNDRGQLTVDSSTISGNSGGGINDYSGTTLITVTNSIVYGNAGRGISGAELIKNSTISGNLGGGIYGGGTVINSTISGNSADKGGGIYGGGTVINSTISDNSAGSIGGGIYGGGTVISSTISGNSASEGGGIYSSRLTITNSTISGNEATNNGGGIYSDAGYSNNGTITMTNVTVSDNSANNGGGLYIAVDSTAYLQNSIIANSRVGGDCQNEGNIGVNSHNLIEDGSCNPALNGDPGLGTLGNYGGKTWTHALLTGSPAIDAGDNSLCPETDQRGVVRPYDGDDDDSAVCDLGAYEVAPFNIYLPVVVKP